MRKSLFVHIPKTGGTSVLASLAESVNGVKFTLKKTGEASEVLAEKHFRSVVHQATKVRKKHNDRIHSDQIFLSYGHFRIAQLIHADIVSPQGLAERFLFSIVRNPWHRLASMYVFALRRSRPAVWRKEKMESRSFGQFIEHSVLLPIPEFDDLESEEEIMDSQLPQVMWLKDNHGNMICDYVGRLEDMPAPLHHICETCGYPRRSLPHARRSRRYDYREMYSTHTKNLIAQFCEEEIDRFKYTFDGVEQ